MLTPDNKKPILIALASDQRYSPGLFCCIMSILYNCDRNYTYEFLILDGGIERDTWAFIERKAISIGVDCRFNRVECNCKSFSRFLPHREGSFMTYARILLPKLTEAEHIIYLDCDLFVGKDISKLWNIGNTDYFAFAVKDDVIKILRNDWEWKEECNIDLDGSYFNAGVMLINLRKWRDNNISEKTLELIEKDPLKCKLYDQTALNRILYNQTDWLKEEWNTMYYKADTIGYKDLDFIIHYASCAPWTNYKNIDSHFLFHKFLKNCKYPGNWKEFGWPNILKEKLLWDTGLIIPYLFLKAIKQKLHGKTYAYIELQSLLKGVSKQRRSYILRKALKKRNRRNIAKYINKINSKHKEYEE